jgi:hypothetical protein
MHAQIVDMETLPLPLTINERQALSFCEKMIAEGLHTFYDVGRALIQIQQQKLYRETHRTFEDYCRKKWNISRPHAYHMIDAARVAENLSQFGDTTLPQNEAQARALKSAPPDQQRDIWQKAVETAPNGKVTAKHIDQVKQREIPVKESPKKDIPKGERTLTFSIFYQGETECTNVTVKAKDIDPSTIRTGPEAQDGGRCDGCRYWNSQHYFGEDGLDWCTLDILSCQYLKERLPVDRLFDLQAPDKETTPQEEKEEKSDITPGGVFYCCHFCSQFFRESQVYVSLNEQQCIHGVICRECAQTALETLLDSDGKETIKVL